MDRALFDKIANTKANQKGDNFRDGKGLLVVIGNLYENMNDGPTFVGKFQIVRSEAKGDLDPATKQPVQPNQPGTQVGWPQKIQKFPSAASNVKAYILELVGAKEAEVDATPGVFQNTMQSLVDKDKQPARGMLVGYETYQQATRSGVRAGQINTYVRFKHVPGQNLTTVKQIRDALDAGKIIDSEFVKNLGF